MQLLPEIRGTEMEASAEDGVLVAAVNELEAQVREIVEGARKGLKQCHNIDEYLEMNNFNGVFKLFLVIMAYTEVMTKVQVKTKREFDLLVERRSENSIVRDSLQKLRIAERDYAALVQEVEGKLSEVEEGLMGEVSLKVGDFIPKGLTLTEARLGATVQLGKYWIESQYTLFVLMRHYA